jgi:glycosyltransferase involved in cell wall biosynthesis
VTSDVGPGAASAAGPTRITFAIDSNEYGGAEAYVIHLLRHLPERFLRSVVATQPVPDRIAAATEELRIPLVTVAPVRSKLDLARLARQARAVISTKPDLVHVNLTIATNGRHLLGALATSRTPTVATLHIVAPIQSRLQARILRGTYGRLRCAIAVSEETRQQLVRDLHLEERAVRLIANGVESRELTMPRETGSTVRLGALGRLTPQKGFDLLIEAVRRLVADGMEITAVIGGEGIDRQALEAQARGAPVDFPGMVDDVPAFFDELDVFCLPSRWEGLPFALLEAMMTGLPCVAANVGDVAAAVGDAGIVIPADDVDALTRALDRLIRSPDERIRLGQAAHERAARQFSVEAMIESTVQVYAEALAR